MAPEPQALLDLQLDRIPPQSAQVRRLMLATSALVDGPIDTAPQKTQPALENAFVMPAAGIIVAGTGCSRPLVLREVHGIAKAIGRDAIIVRSSGRSQRASFDIVLNGAERPLCAYRLWMAQPTGCAWFVPTAAEETYIRLDPLGLEVTVVALFCDEFQHRRGLMFGRQFLNVAEQGRV